MYARLPDFLLFCILTSAEFVVSILATKISSLDRLKEHSLSIEGLNLAILDEMKSRKDIKLTKEELNPVKTS